MARSHGSAMRWLGSLIGALMLLTGLLVPLPVVAAGQPTIICLTPSSLTLPTNIVNACNQTYHDVFSALSNAVAPFANAANGVDVFAFAAPGATAGNPTIFTSNVDISPGSNVPPFINVYGVGPVEFMGASADQPVIAVHAGLNIQFTGLTFADGNGAFGSGGLNIIGNSTVTLLNDTFFGNTTVLNFGLGGGALYNGGGTLHLVNVTVSNNSAGMGAANALYTDTGGTTTISASTIAFNTRFSAPSASAPSVNVPPDIFNKGVLTLTNSIVQGTVGGPNPPTNINTIIVPSVAGLSPLADNGGQVGTDEFTMAALACSIDWGDGFDRGPTGQFVPIGTDARDATRPPTGNACSPGAYQANATPPATFSAIGPASSTFNTGTAYSVPFVAGGTGSYTFTNVSGVPPGMNFTPGGALAGTPTAAGSFQPFFLANDGGGFAVPTKTDATVNAGPTITLNPATLPNGVAGTAYPKTYFTLSNGAPITGFERTSGDFPPGIHLGQDDAGTFIGGLPTTPGIYTITFTAGNSATGVSASREYTITIVYPIEITCGGMGNPVMARVGQRIPCKAVQKDLNGIPHDVTNQVTWSSSNPGVEVDAQGFITADSSGTATITATLPAVQGATANATAQDVSGQIMVIVQPAIPIGIVPPPAPPGRGAGPVAPTGPPPAPAPPGR